ncbi:hypothetical protein V499_08307 [Pseudogymnoascus sp. VKM F-103]|uniref:DUF7137 domain-containing protein n=1 Tax=Pseudogymnoascus verrucosus TaxID=342668 RepID=A0A2P2SW58_9PEZI|nr:uncharacterized protein VE01_00709 [Pseudogymnoascus verrucosus]KFY71473.1 hypothetical protein V499_08307 [Pseudogymnoascus sp. VKM F-103]OBU01080.1 hypothetical protein VE01_00709 [Pseudogymnoascus verrucosus]
MRSTTSFFIYATFFVLLSTFTAAWPWPSFFPEVDSLVVRANEDQSNTQSTSQTSSKPTETPSSGQHKSSSVSESKGSSTASKTTKPAVHTTYDPRLPVGGITVVSPTATAGMPIFKIGDKATFGFNFTDLLATPTALNIMATCTLNQAMYTIAMNQTINGTAPTQQAVWDSNGYETSSAPLVVATYTLIIYDSEGSESDVPVAGYLSPFKSFTFGMYNGQNYADDSGPVPCISCSGAFGSLERNALGFMFGMSIITVMTFTWFVNGLNVIW